MNYKQLVNSVIEAKTNEYPNRRFKLTELLGFGPEGGTYIATAFEWSNNPQQIAIKIQKNMKPNERDFLSNLIQYQNNYENGNNQKYIPTYLIRIYEYFLWQQHHCIIMEVGKENLYDYINLNQNISIQQKEQICFQITQPIHFLHKQKLIHRDIKPENYIKVGNIFKLIDFGLIRSSISDNKTIQVGNAIFQAPEIIENSSSYTEKIDIWSLACVFYEILSSQPLFDGQTKYEISTSIKNHKTQPQVVNNKINQLQTSQKVKDILIKMLTYAEFLRPPIYWVYIEFQNYFNINQQLMIPIIINNQQELHKEIILFHVLHNLNNPQINQQINKIKQNLTQKQVFKIKILLLNLKLKVVNNCKPEMLISSTKQN